MSYALLDVLSGKYVDGTGVESTSSEERLFRSIQSHLTRLLNSRCGSLTHILDYGLPDMAEIYQGLPYSIDMLITAIKKTIEKYEPRIKNVTVKPLTIDNEDCVLHLAIGGQLMKGDVVQFHTYFMTGGNAKVT